MCGICGIFNPKNHKVSQPVIKKMTQHLEHRGPDDEGFYIHNEIALGMRRLSIIDLENGKQPFESADQRYHLIFNGEIYNYQDLRKEFIQKGYKFQTMSDTEVILAAYILYGIDCINKLDGMFAFAIFDSKLQKLTLVRDRLGVKPLYYHIQKDDTFIFSSEIKSLLVHPQTETGINKSSFFNLFHYGFEFCPQTFFKNIHQVLPGHYMEITFDQISQKKYWDLDPFCPKKHNFNENIEEFKSLFNNAVKKRMVSDVPVASYLSGGIDSSSVTALYSKLSNQTIHSFSIGFPHKSFDERSYSSTVADHLDIKHHDFLCQPNCHDLEKLIYYLEDPLITLLNLPLFYLSKTIHDHGYKVVLSGDGADELFGGYQYFKLSKIIKHSFKSKHSKKLIQKLFPHLNNSRNIDRQMQFFNHKYRQNSNLFSEPPPYIYHTHPNPLELFSNDLNESMSKDQELELPFNPHDLKDLHFMDQIFYMEFKMRLLNLTLPLSDKMSMVHSVENRSPFLDYKLAEFSQKLPHHHKLFGLKEKFILKKSMSQIIPSRIIQRTKQPLNAPADWFIHLIGEKAEHYLSEDIIRAKNYFNPLYISQIKNVQHQNKVDYSPLLLMVLFIHLWDDLFIQKKALL